MFSFFSSSSFLKDLLPGFVDIHNHILPGIDDGAKTVEESIVLLKHLEELGITKFINTPHTMNDYYPNTPETIKDALKQLEASLADNNLNTVSLKSSSEYMMDGHFEKLLEEDSILPLHEKYVLVEMSYFQPPINLEEIIYKIGVAGYTPVLAHPERYAFYHNSMSYYKTLKGLGCKLQLNLLSLSSHYGGGVKKTAQALLDTNLYDFAGSDIHHIRHIESINKLKINKSQVQPLKSIIENTSLIFNY